MTATEILWYMVYITNMMVRVSPMPNSAWVSSYKSVTSTRTNKLKSTIDYFKVNLASARFSKENIKEALVFSIKFR